jgi:catechol 2,3-dioxygenase-like lactoylglutathione lyase family enzyme
VRRAFLTLTSSNLAVTRDWYVELLGLRVEFDSDWFVQLQDAEAPGLELGILARDHAVAPESSRGAPGGGYLTVVVDDVDQVHERAKAAGVDVLEAPKDLFYGQRRMLVEDPDGWVVDISSECAPDPDWLRSLGA